MKRVLIANRGEIAVRVIRACKDHGIESVAIYSEEDRSALHAKAADYAFSLNGVSAKDTYLNIEKIISLAKKSGADAVHPGYGFLSENAHFAQAVIDAGLIWIGPPPAAISALGDKVSARRIAAKVGAPLVAGTTDPVSHHEDVIAVVAVSLKKKNQFLAMKMLLPSPKNTDFRLQSKLHSVVVDAGSRSHTLLKRSLNYLLPLHVRLLQVLVGVSVLWSATLINLAMLRPKSLSINIPMPL